MQTVSTEWLKDKNSEQKESIEYALRNNKLLIESLLDILEDFEKQESRSEMALTEYESASWAYKQADRNGARRAFKKVRNLFNFMET